MSDQPVPERASFQRRAACENENEQFREFRRYQFSTHQLARLLQLRSDALDARLGIGRWTMDLVVAQRDAAWTFRCYS
jgi:hypothetical protein